MGPGSISFRAFGFYAGGFACGFLQVLFPGEHLAFPCTQDEGGKPNVRIFTPFK